MSIATRLDERPINGAQIRILVLMQLLLMIEGLDLQLLGLLTPVILKEWAVERAAFGPAMAAALIGLSLGAGMGGRLGDMFGRKRVLMVSALLFAFGTIAAAFTNSVIEMTAVRLLSGLGFGAATPVSIALVAEWLPRRAQPAAISFMAVGTPFGGMVGSVALIALIPLLGWRGCFIACGLLTMALVLMVFIGLPESPAHLAAKGRTDEALRLARRYIDSGLVEADIAPTEQTQAQDDARRKREHVFERRFLRLNIGGWLLFFSAQFIAYSLISWTTTFLIMADFPMAEALQGTFAFNVCAVTATTIAGGLVFLFGSKRVIVVSSLLTLVSLLVLNMALASAGGAHSPALYWAIIVAIGGIGFFDSASIATGYALLTLGYPERIRSTGIGVGLMIGRSGGVLTGLIGGWLLSLAGNRSYPLTWTLIALSLVTLVAGIIVDRHIAKGASAA